MLKKKSFVPQWYEGLPSPRSYRSIFKWGSLSKFKHPNKRLYAVMKEVFNLSDEDFKYPKNLGLEEVSYSIPCALSESQVDSFKEIVGDQNVITDDYSRAAVAYGKTMYDLIRLREGIVENVPDIVLHPRHKEDVQRIMAYCDEQKIPLYVYGGGSSVTRGVEPVKGGISLDMRVHMKRVIRLNETNHTVTVEPGIMGPDLEEALNNAARKLNAQRGYTCGHFPQSFEYSSAGGWVVTRGAGQNSTYYGKIEDLVVCQEYVTPRGTIKTEEYPRMATGPSLDQIMIGSEGAYGVLVSATLKVFRHMPENTQKFSYIFKTWDDGCRAARDIMQSQFGHPSVFRLSDPEETDLAMKLYGVEDYGVDKIMSLRGYKRNKRCLFLGTADGDKDFTHLVKQKVHAICRRHGAMYTTGFVTGMWEHGRFADPYMREDLQDHGIIIDTLECSMNWEQMPTVHSTVRGYVKSRPRTLCLAHISHCYPQGANLYFIFIGKFGGKKEYLEFQQGMLDAIQRSGASMSHHHGIGKMFAPWLDGQVGKNEVDVFRALKKHFDPNNILNPGGTLALDMPDEEKRFNR